MMTTAVEDMSVGLANAHVPVLLAETIALLAPSPGATVVDATLGAGGHAEACLEALGSAGRLLGLDRDERALELARQRLGRFGDRFVPLRGSHADLPEILRRHGVLEVDGILFDLGVSSMQLDDPARGFSFRFDGPLDMRMDPDSGPTAADILASATEDELRRMLRRFGEERAARAVARAIVERRARRPLVRTRELVELVERVAGPAARRQRIHPATRTFQALRIAVNRELDDLERVVTESTSILRRGGRLVVIAYHSLEDRIVKHTLRSLAERCICPPSLPVCGCGRENLLRVLTRRATRPSEAEIARNPRARSARLRAGERL
jgi:16S rRNA (cytosine1402-N4)-methyltransferase